jgi:hypothetical protein
VEASGETPMQVYAQQDIRNSLTAKGTAPLLAPTTKKHRNNFMPESRMTANNSRLTNAASLSSSRNGNYYKAD